MGSTSGPNVRLSCHEYGSWYPLKCRLAVGNAPPLQYTYEFVSPSRVQRRHVLELWRYLYRYAVPSRRVRRIRGKIRRMRRIRSRRHRYHLPLRNNNVYMGVQPFTYAPFSVTRYLCPAVLCDPMFSVSRHARYSSFGGFRPSLLGSGPRSGLTNVGLGMPGQTIFRRKAFIALWNTF